MSDINVQTFSGKVNVTNNLLVGSSHFFVDTVGNKVGITTASPDAGLHVNSNAYVNTDFRVGSNIIMNDTAGQITAGSFVGDGSGLTNVNSDSGSWVNGTSNVYLSTTTDNVGIGTSDPQGQLHISSGTSGDCVLILEADTDNNYEGDNPKIVFRQDGSQDLAAIAMTDNELNIMNSVSSDAGIVFHTGTTSGYTNAVERMRIDPSGNVGIGTSSPGEKLHVNGDLRIGSSPNDTVDDDNNREISTAGQLTIKSNDSGLNGSFVNLALQSGKTNPGKIVIGGGTTNQFRDIEFYTSGSSTERMRIHHNGNVGIGTTSPTVNLHLYGGQDLLYLQKSTNTGGVGMKFTDSTAVSQHGYLRYYHADGESFGTGNCFRFSTDQSSETLALGGCLHIGVDGKDDGYMTNSAGSGRRNLFIQSTYNGNTSQSHGWWIGAQNQGLSSTDNDLYFAVVRSGTIKLCGTMLDQNNANLNFTGQHRTFVKDTPTNQLDDKEGLIVVADQNEFVKMSGGVAYGNDAITINESLPLVSLSTKAKDKRCFGVLSTTEDPETRKEVHGNFASLMRKEKGDIRVYVNSVGEGAIWVTNVNGTLESGDYITTSNVVGYGMKQNDDILHNYTVAKILMDCDFNPQTQVKQVIKKEPKMIDYWVRYGDIKITEEEYHSLPDSRRKIVEDVHYRIDQMEVREEDPEKESFDYEQREEFVNVLDEHGQLQWEDTEETEKAYKVRYLLPDGTQISEDEYTTRALADEKVYIAAFVGCTYHCG